MHGFKTVILPNGVYIENTRQQYEINLKTPIKLKLNSIWYAMNSSEKFLKLILDHTYN